MFCAANDANPFTNAYNNRALTPGASTGISISRPGVSIPGISVPPTSGILKPAARQHYEQGMAATSEGNVVDNQGNFLWFSF